MLDAAQISELAESATIQSLDISMFSDEDILNAVLQRSEVLYDIDRPGIPIRQWSNGNPELLNKEVDKRGTLLLKRAISLLFLEFQTLKQTLDTLSPKRVADIGCGYGFIDLFIAREYGTSLTLIDLEENDATHFGFSTKGAAYSNLETAKKFLLSNGLSSRKIKTLNPEKTDPTTVKNIDLAMSLLSCGFHYPASTYASFWDKSVKQSGSIILDLREARSDAQLQELVRLGSVTTIQKGEKRNRVLVRKSKK